MKECPACGVSVDGREAVCPICGYEFPVRRPLITWTAALLLLLLLLPFLRLLKLLFK